MSSETARRTSRWKDRTFGQVCRVIEGQEDVESPESRSGESVYFLHLEEARRVKIGTSRSPGARVKRLISEQPELRGFELNLIGTVDGGRIVERLLHERFAEHRIGGEWFSDRVLPDVRGLIEEDRRWFGETT